MITKTKVVLSIAIGCALVMPNAAVADAGVNPNRRNSSVITKATKDVRPSWRTETQTLAIAKADDRADVERFRYVCPVRPDIGNYGCRTDQPDEDEAELTEGDVVRAVREIGLPRLEVLIQPGERTLVNARTIFSTEPVPFARSVTLVGFDVDLQATPSSFTWHHGDGTSARTTEAGRPYPAFDVTHRYRAPADVVKPRVDVSYRVRYRVDGGAWSTIGQTITAAGPAGELEVREAAPVLTAP